MIGAAVLLAVAQAAGFWWDMPPERFRAPVEVQVSYVGAPTMALICGSPPVVACFKAGSVYMPVECSPTGQPINLRETIDPRRLIETNPTYCGLTKAHEGGHANGWPGDHRA